MLGFYSRANNCWCNNFVNFIFRGTVSVIGTLNDNQHFVEPRNPALLHFEPLCVCWLNIDMKTLNVAYGPCWESVWSQVTLTLNHIKHPSADPSQPLPSFDKLRLWLHGRLTMSVHQSTWLYHASLDPYNQTEFMDCTWTNFVLDWKNGIDIA